MTSTGEATSPRLIFLDYLRIFAFSSVLIGHKFYDVLLSVAESSSGLVNIAGRIQPVDATHSLNISAGVWKPSVLRGLSFNCRAIALSWSCE